MYLIFSIRDMKKISALSSCSGLQSKYSGKTITRLNVWENVCLVKCLEWVRMEGPAAQFRGYDIRCVVALQENCVLVIGHRLYED